MNDGRTLALLELKESIAGKDMDHPIDSSVRATTKP
jgi:hypothetical protein